MTRFRTTLYLFALTMTPSAASLAQNHSLEWTTGTVAFVAPFTNGGLDISTNPSTPGPWGPMGQAGWGSTPGTAYETIDFAMNDILANLTLTGGFPIVLNVMTDAGDTPFTYGVTGISLPAYGVKLQKLGDAEVTLSGANNRSSAVLRVNTLGPPLLPGTDTPMPATIIQGFTIRDGSVGVELDVTNAFVPLRTEIRDCDITGNLGSGAGGGPGFGGTGILITVQDGHSEYVIEHNRIFGNGMYNDLGVPSYGIFLLTRNDATDSTLIRGNEIYFQEAGITAAQFEDSITRPRVFSNFLWDHEQQVTSYRSGMVFYNNTVYRNRAFSSAPRFWCLYHDAPTAGSIGTEDTMAFLVHGNILDHAPTLDTFQGLGTFFVTSNDVENLLTPTSAQDLRIGLGNVLGRAVPYVDATTPDLHLFGAASTPQIESSANAEILPGVTARITPQLRVPIDVRSDVDGDIRIRDFDGDANAVSDRGGDEVHGLRIRCIEADGTGNLRDIASPPIAGLATANITLEATGPVGAQVAFHLWLDDPAQNDDDTIYSNFFLNPLGNMMLPLGGQLPVPGLAISASGTATLATSITIAPEWQVYWQAYLINSGTGVASNLLRLELNQ